MAMCKLIRQAMQNCKTVHHYHDHIYKVDCNSEVIKYYHFYNYI